MIHGMSGGNPVLHAVVELDKEALPGGAQLPPFRGPR